MVLEFEFEYISDNDLFEYLLHYYAQNFVYSLSRDKNMIYFKIQATEAEILKFCDMLEKLANSVFLKGFDVKVAQIDELTPSTKELKNFEKSALLTSLNALAWLEKKELVDNEWGEFLALELAFADEFIGIDKTNFKPLLEKALHALELGKTIQLKDKHAIYELSLFDEKLQDFLMPTDIKAIKSAFICSNENLKLLASLEKPLVKLRFSVLFRNKHKLNVNEFKLKLADNLFTFALGLALFEKGFKFLNVKKLEHFQDNFEAALCDDRLLVIRGFDFISNASRKLIFAKEDKNMARLSYILSQYDDKTFLIELSKDYEDIFLLNRAVNVLNFKLPSNASEFYESLKKDGGGDRLLANFSTKFPLLEGDFKLKNNFFSLFGLVALILNFDKDINKGAQKLLELSDESKLPRGVKIDFRFKKESKEFDYVRTLRSVMSFLLAGVEPQDIAYGAVESFVFFLRDVYDDFVEKEGLDKVVLTGSLFEHKALLKGALKHLKNAKLSNAPLYI